MSKRVILDASALLAYLFNEKGADVVEKAFPHAMISTVNFTEVLCRTDARGLPFKTVDQVIELSNIAIVEFDKKTAIAASKLYTFTRSIGLSLGDIACLALSKVHDMPVLTADRAWSDIAGIIDVDVKQIR